MMHADRIIFDTLMHIQIQYNTPMQNGRPLAPWKGDVLTSFRFRPIPLHKGKKYYAVYFISSYSGNATWHVNLKGDTTQEERNRLAEVFMDLINTQRI